MIGVYLMFNRNCEEALAAYVKAFDAEISEMRKYGDMPPNPNFPIAETDKNLVLHARLRIEDMEIMCADSSERSANGDNMYVSFTTKDETSVRKAWDILSQDGEVYMDLTPSFLPTHTALCKISTASTGCLPP